MNLLINETLDSYGLIFNYGPKSRALYRSKERKGALINGFIDPLLDELCGFHQSRWRISDLSPPVSSIDANLCFPVLKDRLLKIQHHVQGRGPRGLRSLYQDRRDSYQWWAFWAVVWVGGVSIVLSFIQNILALLQVIYAIKAAK